MQVRTHQELRCCAPHRPSAIALRLAHTECNGAALLTDRVPLHCVGHTSRAAMLRCTQTECHSTVVGTHRVQRCCAACRLRLTAPALRCNTSTTTLYLDWGHKIIPKFRKTDHVELHSDRVQLHFGGHTPSVTMSSCTQTECQCTSVGTH